MPFFNCPNIRIAGVSCALPEQVVEVDSFKSQFDADMVDKFKAMTGIQRFHKTHERQTASDLGFAAAERLLIQKNIPRESVQALVLVSHSTDYRRPATAGILQHRLGLTKECACFDLHLGCSAYPYGLFTLGSMMQSSDIKRALLICAESVTKVANPVDQVTAMLFGDCGSATLLEKDDSPKAGIGGAVRTDGSNYRAIIVPAGGFRNLNASPEMMEWQDGNKRSLYNLVMNGGAVFNFTITEVPKLLKEYLVYRGQTVDDYDSFIMHQANLFILKQIARKLKIPMDKVPLSLDKFGNTSGPAIPLTLCHNFAGGEKPAILHTLMCGFGVGLSWGVTEAVIDTVDLLPVVITDATFDEGIINSPSDFGTLS